MRILMVEDEYALGDVVKERLEQENYEVELALDGEEGEYLALSGTFDLIIMDGMLPEKDGIDVIRSLRKNGLVCPVLMLTARTQLSDKIEGLNCGADDYMTKPFAMEELLARINALLRRNTGYGGDTGVGFGDVVLDLRMGTLTCSRNGKCVNISVKEGLFMEYLLVNQRQTVTKPQIIERVWGYEEDVDFNNVDVYISFLRKKLKHIGAKLTIRTIRGVGYCLKE